MASIHRIIQLLYVHVFKHVLFLFEPEVVHHRTISLGERMGNSRFILSFFRSLFLKKYPSLSQNTGGIAFVTPVGLAAGFDYEARLLRLLPMLGFGFGTVGTLTHRPYGGNPAPMLGRLPRSRSLLVNKGFKNQGVSPTLERWEGTQFAYPVGISIGKTNDAGITQADGVADVVSGFQDAESSGVPFAFYELNISCPNLAGTVEFYEPEHLHELLRALAGLSLSRPVFVKMPIVKTDHEIEGILDVIVQYPWVTGVIIGNLQRDRSNAAFLADEIKKFPIGNFSGKPCQERSDELISLTYRRHGERLIIVGCGGVFSAEDAYRKIQAGATLIQLITGLVFEGPQLVAQINHGLARMLKRDGFQNISAAVGSLHAT